MEPEFDAGTMGCFFKGNNDKNGVWWAGVGWGEGDVRLVSGSVELDMGGLRVGVERV